MAKRYRENGWQKTRILEHISPVRNKGDQERYGNDLILAKGEGKAENSVHG